MQIKTRYDYENLSRPRVNFDKKTDKSMTNQADMENADINKIMAKYEKTGVLIDADGITRQPMYGDFTEVPDYHTALSALRRTEAAFNLLPASVRNRFNNNPQELIEFLDNPENQAEAIKIGLMEDPASTLAGSSATGATNGSGATGATNGSINNAAPANSEGSPVASSPVSRA